MNVRFFLCLLCAFSLSLNLASQTSQQPSNLGQHLRHYQNFAQRFAQEKVYLYFDNDNYFIGEHIWFKAYVLMADNHHYSDMSKTLYVELLSSDGNLVDKLKLRVEDGQAHASFYLPQKLSAGFYEVRAYTRCMLNFDESVVFSRVFAVMDAPQYHKRSGERLAPSMNIRKAVLPNKRPKDNSDKKGDDNKALQVQFFPEGGHLVAGRNNTLAFKASDKQGSDAQVNLSIYDAQNQIVAMAQSEHEGMGSLSLYLQENQTYYGIISDGRREIRCTLPIIEKDAYSLQVNNLHSDILDITVYNDLSSRGDTLALIITCRGQIYQIQPFVNQNEAWQMQVAKSTLPTGVNEILIIDHQGRALASRMLFVLNSQEKVQNIRFAVQQDKESYKAFEQAQVTVALHQQKDSAWIALPHQSFALSIRDNSEYMANAEKVDVFSQLLLASDLKGYIHHPSYYFEKDDRRHRRALDLLMMVQAWRRYDWVLMSQPEQFTLKHPIEKGILLDGKLLSVVRRMPVPDMHIKLWMLSDSSSTQGFCLSDEQGDFNFLFDFEGKQDLNLMVTDGKHRRNVFVTINRHFSPSPRLLSPKEMQAPVLRQNDFSKKQALSGASSKERELIIMPGDVLLNEVEVSGKQLGTHNEIGKVSVTYETQEELDVLEDKAMYTYDDVPTFLTQINEHFHFRYIDSDEVLYYKHAPVRFIINHKGALLSVENYGVMPGCQEVERMEIIEPSPISHIVETERPTDFNNIGKDIAYVVLVLHPNNEIKKDVVGIQRTTLQGYNRVVDFYHPRYDKVLDTDPGDHRRTLYWNPNVRSDEKGQAKIVFYNSATSKHFDLHGVVISEQGKIGWR